MTFPAVLLILDVYPLRRPAREGWARVLAEKMLYLVPALVAAGAAFAAQYSVEDMRTLAEHPLGARIAQAAYGLCFYPWKTLLPTDLSPLYLLRPGFDAGAPRFVVSGALVVAVTAGLVAMRHRWPWALAAWTAYAVIVSPVLGLAQTGPQLVADRYSYLSCLPWALLAATAVFHMSRGSRRALIAARGGAVLAVAVLAAMTFRQASIWTDSETLWSHAIRLDPTNHIAFTNRGFAGADPQRSLVDYGEALRLEPRFYLAYFNRGELRQQLGDHVGAVADYTAAIDVLPRDPKAYNNRGWAKQALGDVAGAAADYRQALDLAPARLGESRPGRRQSGASVAAPAPEGGAVAGVTRAGWAQSRTPEGPVGRARCPRHEASSTLPLLVPKYAPRRWSDNDVGGARNSSVPRQGSPGSCDYNSGSSSSLLLPNLKPLVSSSQMPRQTNWLWPICTRVVMSASAVWYEP